MVENDKQNMPTRSIILLKEVIFGRVNQELMSKKSFNLCGHSSATFIDFYRPI